MRKNKTRIISEGQQYGSWSVIRPSGQDRKLNYLYLCKCACGKIQKIIGSRLLSGSAKRCRSCAAFIANDKSFYRESPRVEIKTNPMPTFADKKIINTNVESAKSYACEVCKHISINIEIKRNDFL